MEAIARNIVGFVPWSYAYVSSLSLFVLAFAIVEHPASLHGTNPGATNWSITLPVHLFLVLGVAVKVAGMVLCIGWYVSKDIDANLECPRKRQEVREDCQGARWIPTVCDENDSKGITFDF
jgi:hypothetical protein